MKTIKLIVICIIFCGLLPELIAFDGKNNKSYPYNRLKLGIDVLIESNFSLISGKRVGLLANSSSRASDERMTAEHFALSKNFVLTAIFTPEHGFYSSIPAGQYVPDDSIYGVPVFSLYGNNRKPTPWQMSLIDIIVVDLQDIGIRSYTFISTLFKVMEAASEANKPVIVLDRPNPLGGEVVDGNVLDPKLFSFVGIAPIPYLHGMTIAELATMFNQEGWIARKCELIVVRMENWNRSMQWEDTGLRWFPTSPNIVSVNSIRGAAMLGVFGELRLFNLGVGGATPFQVFSVGNRKLNTLLNRINFLAKDGVIVKPCGNEKSKTLTHYHQINCVSFSFEKGKKIKLYTLGFKFIFAVRRSFPELFNYAKISKRSKDMFTKVTGSDKLLDAIVEGNEAKAFEILNAGVDNFLKLRENYLLYN